MDRLRPTDAGGSGRGQAPNDLPADARKQLRYFETLITISPVAIVMVDRDTRVTLWNPAAERLFGYTADEAMGRDIDELVDDHPEVRDEATSSSVEA